MVRELEAIGSRDRLLLALDGLVHEFRDLAAIKAHDVVMMFTAVELVNCVPTLEIVPDHQAGGFELRQYSIDRGYADFIACIE
jgi:hypothetical protein